MVGRQGFFLYTNIYIFYINICCCFWSPYKVCLDFIDSIKQKNNNNYYSNKTKKATYYNNSNNYEKNKIDSKYYLKFTNNFNNKKITNNKYHKERNVMFCEKTERE